VVKSKVDYVTADLMSYQLTEHREALKSSFGSHYNTLRHCQQHVLVLSDGPAAGPLL
jgi:hypothetical protein